MASPPAKLLWQATHRDKVNTWKRNGRLRARILAIYVYSNGMMACEKCGVTEFSFLTLDHINGGGTSHRLTDRRANCKMPHLLKSQGFPVGYRVLCQNCNFKTYITSIIPGQSYRSQAVRRHRISLKARVLTAYAGEPAQCAMCDESDLHVLTIDHIMGGGREEMNKLGLKGGSEYYRKLIHDGYPKGFQVLCFNHNSGKRVLSPTIGFIRKTLASWTGP